MMDALAHHIESLTLERDRWRNAYVRLACNRMRWIDATLKTMPIPQTESKALLRKRIADVLKQRLRRW